MNIREEIKNNVLKALKVLGYEGDFSIKVFKSGKASLGDYFVNIAKIEDRDLLKIEEKMKEGNKGKYFEKIEIVNPGSISFFVSKEYVWKEIGEALKKGKMFGQFPKKKEKIQIEFISANPVSPLTVANGREGIFGDVLGNVFKKYGCIVKKAYRVNDQGKLISVLGHSVLKDDEAEYAGDYIDKMHRKIKGRDAYVVGKKASKIVMEEIIKKTIRKLKIKFDEYSLESLSNKEIDKALNLLKGEELSYEQEGSEWFMSTALGDERDRVIIKSDNEKTYLLKDIAYHKHKFEKKKFDKIIDIWGSDHLGNASGLIAGVEAMLHINKLQVVVLQFVVVVEEGKIVRMSKKSGEFIMIEDLLKELPIDVIRFFFLMESADNRLNFDLDLAKDRSENNPVLYVQKAYSKISSIIKDPRNILGLTMAKNISLLSNKKEMDLMKQVLRFPEIIEDIINNYDLQMIPQYAIALANSFNKFYSDCYIPNKERKIREAQLGLIMATKIALKNTLDLMGVSAPEKI